MYAYPAGVTPTSPSGSPSAESKPAETMIKSGLKSLMIGFNKISGIKSAIKLKKKDI